MFEENPQESSNVLLTVEEKSFKELLRLKKHERNRIKIPSAKAYHISNNVGSVKVRKWRAKILVQIKSEYFYERQMQKDRYN